MNPADSLTVIIRRRPLSAVEENAFSQKFCSSYIKKFADSRKVLAIPYHEVDSVKKLQDMALQSHTVLLINDDDLILPPLAFNTIPEALAAGKWAGIMPVFNLSSSNHQLAGVKYPYHNIRNFLEIAELHFKSRSSSIKPVEGDAEFPCIFLRTEVLFRDGIQDMDIEQFLEKLKNNGEIGQMQSVFAHRFGDYGSAPRTDLISLLPHNTFKILDIGCARGELGAALKQKQECYITGVEINREMARDAAKIYDKLYFQPVEQVSFDTEFDAIFMGDVIEHLYNPGKVLEKLTHYLAQDGVIIGSIPNSGHWSIVYDLAMGHFEMIPFGLLCMSHIRFFTKKELDKLMQQAGLEIDRLETDCPVPTPHGEKFINLLVSNKMGEELSLKTAEFRFRAVASR